MVDRNDRGDTTGANNGGSRATQGPSRQPGEPARCDPNEYLELLACLAEAKDRADVGVDDLEAGLQALVAVLAFLEAEPAVTFNMLHRPLAVLAHTVRDVIQGAKPPIIFKRNNSDGGRPANASIHAARAAMAFCVDALIKAKMKPLDAARFVLTEAGEKRMTCKSLLAYRAEMNGGRAPGVAQGTFKQMAADWEQVRLQLGNDLPTIKKEVRGALGAKFGAGF
jgi:hypothetical protein